MTNKLTVYLNANIASFDTAIKKAAKSIGSISSAASAAGKYAAVGFAAAGGALAALGMRQAAYIEQTNNLASSLGVNVRELQALSRVAEEAGVNQDALAIALQKTQKAIFEAADGTKSYVEAFDKIGLKANDLIKLKPDQQFLKIAEALAAIENPAQRTALAMELFGRNGRAIINILPDLAAKVDEARAFNDKFNISLNAIDAAKVDEAGDSFARIGAAVGGLGNTIAVEFSPLVTAASQALLEAGISGETFSNAVKGAVQIATGVIDNFRISILGIKAVWLEIKAAVLDAIAELSLKIRDFGQAIKETLELIPGVSIRSSDSLIDLALSAKQAANAARGSYAELENQAGKFETTAQKVKDIQDDATSRAEQSVAAQTRMAEALNKVKEGTDAAAASTKKLARETDNSSQKIDEFKKISRESFNVFGSQLDQARSKMSTFGQIAFDILGKVADAFSQKIFGASGGGGGGGIAGLASQVLGSVVGKVFGVPSFASGSRYIPRDMTAKVHQGEMIIPRDQVSSMGTSGSSVINIDARGAQQGVEEKIRQVMQQVNLLRQDTPKIAMSAVADQNRRNPNFVR